MAMRELWTNQYGSLCIGSTADGIVVANNGTLDIAADTHMGKVYIWTISGAGAEYQMSGSSSAGGSNLLGFLSTILGFVVGAPTGILASQIGLERTGGVYRINNKSGASQTFSRLLLGGTPGN